MWSCPSFSLKYPSVRNRESIMGKPSIEHTCGKNDISDIFAYSRIPLSNKSSLKQVHGLRPQQKTDVQKSAIAMNI
jgi:hypothetical protein